MSSDAMLSYLQMQKKSTVKFGRSKRYAALGDVELSGVHCIFRKFLFFERCTLYFSKISFFSTNCFAFFAEFFQQEGLRREGSGYARSGRRRTAGIPDFVPELAQAAIFR